MLSGMFLRTSTFPLLHIFAAYALLPVLGPYFRGLGHNDAWISLAFALFGAGYIIAGLAVGYLTERYGRVRVVRSALIVNMAAYGLYFLGTSGGILLARLVDGACFGFLTIIGISTIEDRVTDRERGTKTGLYLTFESGVRLLAPVLGGFLADRFIGAPFLLSTGILIGLVLLLHTLIKDHRHSATTVSPVPTRVALFFRSPRLQPLILLGFVVQSSTPIIMLFIPLFITGTLGFSYVYAGLAVSVYGASHLLQFMFGHFVDSIGRKRLLTLGSLVYALALIGLTQAGGSIGAVLVFVALAGVGNSLWSVAAVSYLSSVASEFGEKETMLGTYVSIAKVGEVVSFLLGGLLIAAVSEIALFWTVACLMLVGSVLSSFLFIRLSRREREERHRKTA